MLLRETIDRLTVNTRAHKLFPFRPTIFFDPEAERCPLCGGGLKVLKTKPRELATLLIGDFVAWETKLYCPRCDLRCGSEQLARLVPKGAKFGYDVLVYGGKGFFLRCRNAKEIATELNEKNISISTSEVTYLARKFVMYLAVAHRKVQRKTKAYLQMHGGYILHLDGTCEGGSPHLISALDGITEIVLENMKIPTESSQQVIPFLQSIKKAYGDPLAVVSDMGKGIVLAIQRVFKKLPHFLCHFHFLRDLGTDLFGKENDTIRNRLRKHGIQETLRKRLRSLNPLISGTPHLVEGLADALERSRTLHSCPLQDVPASATYLLILWTLAGKSQGNGYGFPFDQPYLRFYLRLRKLGSILDQLHQLKLQGSWKDNRIYGKVLHDLVGVVNDAVLADAASRMQQKVQIFDQLRAAMRITSPEGKRGLNDNGELSNIRTIEKTVGRFTDRLRTGKEYANDKDYQNMLKQLEQYWQKLFSDPLVVKTKTGTLVVQPQRTNNIVEQLFRDLSRRYRKKSGLNCRERTINAMLADTPLVKNLENQNYLSILLNGKSSLEERFAEIDANDVRDRMLKIQGESVVVSSKMKKLIKLSELPESVLSVFEQHLLDPRQPPETAPESTSTTRISECHSPHRVAPAIPAGSSW
jgi:hypothetical protein